MKNAACALLAIILSAAFLSDAGARQSRNGYARRAFRHDHPCPSTGITTGPCPGFVIDHDDPLCAGGADDPTNMRWQERREAAEKDALEREICQAMRSGRAPK